MHIYLSYYYTLKIASAFKTFTAKLPVNDNDYGLELAVRRRLTKSLQGEDQLRKKLVASLYGEQGNLGNFVNPSLKNVNMLHCSDVSTDNIKDGLDLMHPFSSPPSDLLTANRTMSDIGRYEDWFGNEVVLPRDTDRIMEQFVLMLLRIGAYLNKDSSERHAFYGSTSQAVLPKAARIECSAINTEDTDTPPLVGCSKGKLASYLRDYPQIFMKKPSEVQNPMSQSENDIQFENNSEKLNLRGLLLGTAKTVSLVTDNENEDNVHNALKETLRIKQEESNKTTQNSERNCTDTFRGSKDYSHDIKSNGSLESIINRMKLRAARFITNSSDSVKKDGENSKKILSSSCEQKRKCKKKNQKTETHDKCSESKRKQ